MKKVFVMLTTVFLLLIQQTFVFAAEDKPTIPYFGIGATVQEQQDGSYLVKTVGEKPEEGFIFTPKETFTSTSIRLEIALRGEGTVLLKISETDPKGKFIKDKVMEVSLTADWAVHTLPFELSSKLSQIDVSVVTKDKGKTQFSFKDIKIVQQ